MQIRLLSWLFFCASLALISARAQVPAAASAASLTESGSVKAVKVTGTASLVANGATSPLKVDDAVPQAGKIVTALNSSVVLAFSNGATTQLGPDTEFVLEEFLQDPFASTIKVGDLSEEPSVSRTKLKLNKGELVGNVKKLKHGSGSSFTIETPVGAAGIRGTTFRIVFRPAGSGQAFNAGGAQNFQFSLSTLEGDVGFAQGSPGSPAAGAGNNQPSNQAQGGQPGSPEPGAAPQNGTGTGTPNTGGPLTSTNNPAPGISVPTGQEINVTVMGTQGAQGQIVLTTPPPTVSSTVPMSPTVAATVSSAAQNLIAATASVTFPAPALASSSVNSGANSGTGQGGGTTGGENPSSGGGTAAGDANSGTAGNANANATTTSNRPATTGNPASSSFSNPNTPTTAPAGQVRIPPTTPTGG